MKPHARNNYTGDMPYSVGVTKHPDPGYDDATPSAQPFRASQINGTY